MKFDDARLEQSRREAEDRIRNFNTLTLAVIRSHLLIEQTMDNFLEAALFHPEYVCKTFGFDQKVKLCRSMCFNEDGDQIWKIVKAANELRNTIAHSLGGETAGKPGSKPASPAQLLFAEKIAQEKGVVIADEAKASSAAMSAWIESNLRIERGKRRRKPGNTPPKSTMPKWRGSNKGSGRRKPDAAAAPPTPAR